jgi:hypothetical protein
MNEFPLLNGLTQETVAYACGKCGTVKSPKTFYGTPELCMESARKMAEECCLPRKCSAGCGSDAPRHWLQCDTCRRADEESKEAEKVSKAKLVSLSDYDQDYVFIGERLVSTDDLDDETGVFWAVSTEHGITLDARDILESACEDRHEDAIDDLDVESLQAALDAWCAEQNICTYRQDDDLIVEKGDCQ